jgi:predicted HTH domain antitoxin
MDEDLSKDGVTVALAERLFAEKTISLGKAARLARIPIEDLIVCLGAMGIPAVDYPPEEIDDELAEFEGKDI